MVSELLDAWKTHTSEVTSDLMCGSSVRVKGKHIGGLLSHLTAWEEGTIFTARNRGVEKVSPG